MNKTNSNIKPNLIVAMWWKIKAFLRNLLGAAAEIEAQVTAQIESEYKRGYQDACTQLNGRRDGEILNQVLSRRGNIPGPSDVTNRVLDGEWFVSTILVDKDHAIKIFLTASDMEALSLNIRPTTEQEPRRGAEQSESNTGTSAGGTTEDIFPSSGFANKRIVEAE